MRPKILVVERGCWLPFAQALTPDADVLLFTEYREIAAEARNAMVGRDIPGITRVDSMWKVLDDVDTIAFPDVGDGDMQMYLRSKGYHVWGSGDAEMLELSRWDFNSLLKKIGLFTVPTRLVVGMDALEAILRKEQDLYLKLSYFRGDGETRHHEDWDRTSQWFYERRYRLGPHADEVEWIVQDPLKAKEIGYDGYCVDGRFPDSACWGWEDKDRFYVGRACRQQEMPAPLQDVNAAIAGSLGSLGMRGNFATEVRCTDDDFFVFNDPTCRCPSPPIGVQSINITNWVEIVTAGARGEIVEPDFQEEYMAEVELIAPCADKEWSAIDMPEDVVPFVRLRRACLIDGRYWSIPSVALGGIIGSACGIGSTPEAAIEQAVSIAEQVSTPELIVHKGLREEMAAAWEEAQEVGG